MEYFYDGQIRRYLTQIIRLLSNFVVKYGDGTLVRIPVAYGDTDRQVSSILNQNSENALQNAPRIGVYITGMELDTNRLADSSYVGKLHIRERRIDVDDEGNEFYSNRQGENYTVERLMPTPYKLTVKVDIWTTSTDQKLQVLEQILMLFNPSLEIQTTDNYIDWTSLSVVDLTDVVFSSRTIPVGTGTEIDIASLTLVTPIYISPPAKVKRLGVVTSVVANILGSIGDPGKGYISGLGVDFSVPDSQPTNIFANGSLIIKPGNYSLEVEGTQAKLLSSNKEYASWVELIEQTPNIYKAGLTRLYLKQYDDTFVVGSIALNPADESSMIVEWDQDTYHMNTSIASDVRESQGTFDAIIDPQKTGPGAGLPSPVPGVRYLILDDIGGGIKDEFEAEKPVQRINTNISYRRVVDHKVFVDDIEVGSGNLRIPDNNETGNYYIILDEAVSAGSIIRYEVYVNEDGADAWKNLDSSDFIASANDLIEWNGSKWQVVFSAKSSANTFVYQTNIFTGTQYEWNGVYWKKSFEGEYRSGDWRIEL
jgi:hypothetical protein